MSQSLKERAVASNRHLGRIVAMQTLYERDFHNAHELTATPANVTKRNLDQYKGAIGDTKFVRDLVEGVSDNLEKIDKLIGPAAPEWPVDQIARLDKIIIRIAVYELKFKKDTPPKVAINEAVELAKSFGGENSSKFVNGVLGTIYRGKRQTSTKTKPKS